MALPRGPGRRVNGEVRRLQSEYAARWTPALPRGPGRRFIGEGAGGNVMRGSCDGAIPDDAPPVRRRLCIRSFLPVAITICNKRDDRPAAGTGRFIVAPVQKMRGCGR